MNSKNTLFAYSLVSKKRFLFVFYRLLSFYILGVRNLTGPYFLFSCSISFFSIQYIPPVV